MAHRLPKYQFHNAGRMPASEFGIFGDKTANDVENLRISFTNLQWDQEDKRFTCEVYANGALVGDFYIYEYGLGNTSRDLSFAENRITLHTPRAVASYYMETKGAYAEDTAVLDKVLKQNFQELNQLNTLKYEENKQEKYEQFCEQFNKEHTVDKVYNTDGEPMWGNKEPDRPHEENEEEDPVIEPERPHEESVTVYIDSDKVGAIIGKQGANIKNITKESGARINIDKDKPGEISITGSEESIGTAVDLIRNITPVKDKDGNNFIYNQTAQTEVNNGTEEDFLTVPVGTEGELKFDTPSAPMPDELSFDEPAPSNQPMETLTFDNEPATQENQMEILTFGDSNESFEEIKARIDTEAKNKAEENIRSILENEENRLIENISSGQEIVWRLHTYEKDKATGEVKEYDGFYPVTGSELGGNEELIHQMRDMVAGVEPKGNCFIIENSEKEIIQTVSMESYERDIVSNLIYQTRESNTGEMKEPSEVISLEEAQNAIAHATDQTAELNIPQNEEQEDIEESNSISDDD